MSQPDLGELTESQEGLEEQPWEDAGRNNVQIRPSLLLMLIPPGYWMLLPEPLPLLLPCTHLPIFQLKAGLEPRLCAYSPAARGLEMSRWHFEPLHTCQDGDSSNL